MYDPECETITVHQFPAGAPHSGWGSAMLMPAWTPSSGGSGGTTACLPAAPAPPPAAPAPPPLLGR